MPWPVYGQMIDRDLEAIYAYLPTARTRTASGVGNGSTTGAGSSTPSQVVGLTAGAQSITGGEAHACAVVNGGARCWGDNTHGELGEGSTTSSFVPVEVSGLSSFVDAIAAGRWFTCAVVHGAVQCWGDGDAGELGNGTTTGSSTPTQVVGLVTGVQAIAVGDRHACAVVNGGVLCWGDNSSGQLGNGSTEGSAVPVPVVGLESGVDAIAAGTWHTCAVVNGGVQCWGSDRSGQLGDGTTIVESHTPVQVLGLTSGAKAVTAGRDHTCALVDRGAECWGVAGQLGTLSLTGSAFPVPVFGLAP